MITALGTYLPVLGNRPGPHDPAPTKTPSRSRWLPASPPFATPTLPTVTHVVARQPRPSAARRRQQRRRAGRTRSIGPHPCQRGRRRRTSGARRCRLGRPGTLVIGVDAGRLGRCGGGVLRCRRRRARTGRQDHAQHARHDPRHRRPPRRLRRPAPAAGARRRASRSTASTGRRRSSPSPGWPAARRHPCAPDSRRRCRPPVPARRCSRSRHWPPSGGTGRDRRRRTGRGQRRDPRCRRRSPSSATSARPDRCRTARSLRAATCRSRSPPTTGRSTPSCGWRRRAARVAAPSRIPRRYRCLTCGSEAPTETVALPRAGRDLHAGHGPRARPRARQSVHGDAGRARRHAECGCWCRSPAPSRARCRSVTAAGSCSVWSPCGRACPTTATASCRTHDPSRPARRWPREARGDGRCGDDPVRRAVRPRASRTWCRWRSREAVGSVDKGFDRADIEAAWFGELVTTDGFATGILADTLWAARHPRVAPRERLRHRQRRRAPRRDRRRQRHVRRRARGRRRQGARDLDAAPRSGTGWG